MANPTVVESIFQILQFLNWFPISDWDKVGQVDFTVDGLDAESRRAYAHTGYFWKRPTG